MVALILVAMKQRQRRQPTAEEWGAGWQWPVPDLITPDGTFPAMISQEFRAAAPPHLGVDVLYRGSGVWFAPEDTPVVAARAGTLWSVTRTARGWAVVVDHGKPWATFYQHLADVDPAVAAGRQGVQRQGAPLAISAGQRLGTMGSDPTDASHVRHLHFAAWFKGAGDDASVDPAAQMRTWARSTWNRGSL